MSQLIEAEYDEFIKDIQNKLQKIEPHLAMQAMYYERKFTDIEPHAEILVEYKKEADLDKKRFALGQKYGFEIATEIHHELRVVGLMTLDTIYEISKDADVENISGTISCASY
ncbi:MAG: hypothetical protein KGH88_01565 [Thaumarchaeota archaeon]|nr:hypothetical protein [Nitrososphaerota archaeon]